MTPEASQSPVVDVRDLRVELAGSGVDVIDEVTLQIARGEVLGLVGESGCGKTTVGMAMLGHCREGARVAAGSICIDGRDLTAMSAGELDRTRGRVVAYIPQDPPTALNPALRIGVQLREVLDAHTPEWTAEQREARLRETLDEVSLASDDAFLRRFPHQLSGGQQQRVVIAMAFACRPRVIVCDEPTTGLDVGTQARVLETILGLSRLHGVAVLYVSHDLAVVATIASRVAVMYGGRVVETASREELFRNPRHPYTRRLLLAVPEQDGSNTPIGIPGYAPAPGSRPTGCFFAPRCPLCEPRCTEAFPPVTELAAQHDVRCYRAAEETPVVSAVPTRQVSTPGDAVLDVDIEAASYGDVTILHDISLMVRARECLALVGESGSGKTTLARCIAGLHEEYRGAVSLEGTRLAPGSRRRVPDQRRRVQFVFQNPYASLNPRHTIGKSMETPLRLFFGLSGAEARRRVGELLELVSLPARVAGRHPGQLSGGERQRVAIARALAADPALLVCDEVTSALDVSVQASIIALLARLQNEMGLSLLFITHNLPLIRTIADRVAVMSAGRIVEYGDTARLFEQPEADYTKSLLAHTPTIAPAPADRFVQG